LSCRFSVVIPLYNKDSHIIATINSVLLQSFEDFEIIVVDDGSTDSSVLNVRSIGDFRMVIIQQENQGVSSARNRGIKESVGEYVAFLDADDNWYPWHLEELNGLIEKHDGYGVYSVAHEVLENGEVFKKTKPCGSDFKGVVDDFFLAYSNGLSLVNSTTACIPRSLLLSIDGFPDGVNKGEDVCVWLDAAIKRGFVFSSRVSACVNRDAQCRSDTNKTSEIPYFLKWLEDELAKGVIRKQHRDSASFFLKKAFLHNAAGFSLGRNNLAFNKMRELQVAKSFRMRGLLLILHWTPVFILKLMKKLKNS